MKTTSLFSPAAVALLAAGLFAAATVAQAPQPAQPGPGGPPQQMRHFPKPQNLKVLPKNLNGQQVRRIMSVWARSLGVHCDNCHAADPHKLDRFGHPELDFPSDKKQDKDTARLMYKMVKQINGDYISMVTGKDGKPAPPVTCGTCHRGHLDPPKYVLPKERPFPMGGRPPAAAGPA